MSIRAEEKGQGIDPSPPGRKLSLRLCYVGRDEEVVEELKEAVEEMGSGALVCLDPGDPVPSGSEPGVVTPHSTPSPRSVRTSTSGSVILPVCSTIASSRRTTLNGPRM